MNTYEAREYMSTDTNGSGREGGTSRNELPREGKWHSEYGLAWRRVFSACRYFLFA